MPDTRYDFFVQWHLTERCNLRCSHCYQGVTPSELDFDEICWAIDKVKATLDSWVTDYDLVMSPSLHFTGGEPVLRKDLFVIMEYARQLGFSTALMTNGTLVTREIAYQLKEGYVSDVQVSLDGLERTHDRIRGNGSFRRAADGVNNLLSFGIGTHINVTVSRLNVGELEELAAFSRSLGVDRLTYSRLVPCGRGSELGDEMLSPHELADLHRIIRKSSGEARARISSGDPLAMVPELDDEALMSEFPVGGCAAGVFGVTITSNGSIMPCRRMDLVIGNIMIDSLRALWAESPVLAALRNREAYHDGCDSCRYWPVCRGCRAIALAYARARGNEDYLGPDHQCPYYKARW